MRCFVLLCVGGLSPSPSNTSALLRLSTPCSSYAGTWLKPGRDPVRSPLRRCGALPRAAHGLSRRPRVWAGSAVAKTPLGMISTWYFRSENMQKQLFLLYFGRSSPPNTTHRVRQATGGPTKVRPSSHTPRSCDRHACVPPEHVSSRHGSWSEAARVAHCALI